MENNNLFEKLMNIMSEVDISAMSETEIKELVSGNFTGEEMDELSDFLTLLMGEMGEMANDPKEYFFGTKDQEALMKSEKENQD